MKFNKLYENVFKGTSKEDLIERNKQYMSVQYGIDFNDLNIDYENINHELLPDIIVDYPDILELGDMEKIQNNLSLSDIAYIIGNNNSLGKYFDLSKYSNKQIMNISNVYPELKKYIEEK
jgi:hypothetical protein